MVAVSYLFHYDTLSQNATDIITKCDSYFYYKVYYKMHQVFYYKMRQFYYKIRRLLENASLQAFFEQAS